MSYLWYRNVCSSNFELNLAVAHPTFILIPTLALSLSPSSRPPPPSQSQSQHYLTEPPRLHAYSHPHYHSHHHHYYHTTTTITTPPPPPPSYFLTLASQLIVLEMSVLEKLCRPHQCGGGSSGGGVVGWSSVVVAGVALVACGAIWRGSGVMIWCDMM